MEKSTQNPSRVNSGLLDRLFHGLRFQLVVLVLLAILPALMLIVYTTSEQQRLAAMQAREDALKLARATANNQEQILEGARQLLAALSQLAPVRSRNQALCNSVLASLLSQYPSYANLGVIDRSGMLFCSALPLGSEPINAADRPYFQRSLETRAFNVGEFQYSRLIGEPVLTLAYPILDEQKNVSSIVFAGLSLNWLNRNISKTQLPSGAFIQILDRDGLTLARYPDSEQWLGKPMVETNVANAVLTHDEGWLESPDAQKIDRLYVFTQVQSVSNRDMYVVIGIPHSIAFAESNQVSFRNLIALGLVGVLALAAGRVGGDLFILHRVNALVNATRRLAQGDLQSRTGLPNEGGELGTLANAFDHMAETMEQRETERERMKHALVASVHRSEALAGAASRLNARLELDEVLRAICEEAARALNVPAACVCLYDPTRDQFDWAADYGLPGEYPAEMAAVPHKLFDRNLVQIGAPLIIPDALARPDLPRADLFKAFNIRTIACASMLRDRELVGILQVFTIGEPREFTNDEMMLLRGLTDQAALAIANARLYDALKQQEQAHAFLLRRTITAQEDERMRIARELHDETSQSLTALMVGLDTANLLASSDLSKARGQMETVRTIAQGMLSNIHRLIADLRPSLLDHRGLVPAIAWYGTQRLKPQDIELQLEENLSERLPPLVESCLFRIVQEGFTNVIRHAHASQVRVQIWQQGDCLMLQLSDNGCGFEPNVLSEADVSGKGLGLRGMQERVVILGGTFDLQTSPNHGTSITIRISLSDKRGCE
jgi:signal transduction histidine kinase